MQYFSKYIAGKTPSGKATTPPTTQNENEENDGSNVEVDEQQEQSKKTTKNKGEKLVQGMLREKVVG